MDMSFARHVGRALDEALTSPAHRVQQVLHVTQTQWQVRQNLRTRAGAVPRSRGPAPGAMARRAR